MLGFFIQMTAGDFSCTVANFGFNFSILGDVWLSMHPFVKILYFILILLLVSMVGSQMLTLLLVVLALCTLWFRAKSFVHAVRRMRWLFLSILIIYAFGTPGELVPQFPVNAAPTFEGIQLGLQQIEKLLIALAALSLLLTSSSREHMMLGLYMLLLPFKFIELNVERFAARLLLTLNYVEELAAEEKKKFSFTQLDAIHAEPLSLPHINSRSDDVVSFQQLPFNSIDKIMMVLLAVLSGMMIYWSFL